MRAAHCMVPRDGRTVLPEAAAAKQGREGGGVRDESRFAASDTDVSHDSKCHAGVGASSKAELKVHKKGWAGRESKNPAA